MAETPIRRQASENDAEKMLRLCADDPMWAAHAEVSKSLLVRAADELAALRKDADRYRWLRANTHGEQDGRGRQEFCMPDPCPRANIMRGSVAQHLDAAIDADMLEAEAVRKAVGAA